MKKSFKKVFWLVLVLVISNSLAYLDPQTLLSEPDKELPDDSETIILEISDSDNGQIPIGDQGTFSLVTDFIDNEKGVFDTSDIEELTSFNASIQVVYNNSEYTYYAKCRLWKPLNEPIYTFCKLEKSLDKGEYISNFEGNIKYKGYSIYIFSTSLISIQKINSPLPLLYSSQQNIVIEKGKENYELVFKIEEYNNELLLLETLDVNEILALDECSQKGKEMKCIIKKQTIEKVLANNVQTFFLKYKSDNVNALSFSYSQFKLVFDIVVTDNTIQKKDVYVYVTKLLEHNISNRSLFTFETTITDIDDFTSSNFQLTYNENRIFQCFLKKITGNPLFILCSTDSSSNTINIHYIKEKRLDDVSIKYDFLIAQGFNYESVSLSERRVISYFAYPKVLDYTLKDSYTIDFLIDGYSENINDIRLNSNSRSLNCSNIGYNIKRCIVPKSHFGNEESGYFFAYCGTSSKFYEMSPIQVILPKNMDIILRIIGGNQVIGQKGIIILSTNYNDNEKNEFDSLDIDNYITFRGIMKYNTYNKCNANCKIWKPNDGNIKIICKLNEILREYRYNFKLNEVVINYKDYKIHIYQEDPIEVDLYSYHIPFLYYDNQTINIDNKDSYELKFKVESYNNDILYIKGESNNYAILDNCKRNINDLNCNIQKNKLEEILTLSGEQFRVGTMNDYKGLIQFDYVSNITINYNNVAKEDLFIEITKIAGDTNEMDNPIALETNITSIPNFISKQLQGLLYFKKTIGRPLILFYNNYGSSYINFNIDKEEIINDTHYKYNFRIQPCEIRQYIDIRGNRNEINLIYPEKLDFSLEDSLIIRYITPSTINLRLIQDSSDLECGRLDGMIKCNVSLYHFFGKKSEYYDTYYSNYENFYTICYNIPSINVIIPENMVNIFIEDKDNNGNINIGDNYLIYFITNFIDNENIFDESDIEKTEFSTTIMNKYERSATCRLWKPLDEKIRIFCKLNYASDIYESNIYLINTTFNYKDKRINIISKARNIYVKKFNNQIPFLYSSKQTVNIEKEKESYDLIFKIWEYNNETLFLQINEPSLGYKHIILDNCSIDNKDLKCKVPKEKFEEVLYKYKHNITLNFYAYENQQSKVGQVLDIIVNNNQYKKENIYVDLTKIKEDQINKTSLITYETNVTNIPNVFSDIFELHFKEENETNKTIIKSQNCFFQKISEPLLLFCLMTNEGNFSFFHNETKQIFNNKNIKYNFIILPMKNQINFIVNNFNGKNFFFEYPIDLVFYKKENYDIYYHYLGNNYDSSGIKLNPDSDLLKCYDTYISFNRYYKRCNISINHFNGKKSGYFNTYYINSTNNNSLVYNLPPIKITLPEENEIILRIKSENNKNSVKTSQNGIITFKIIYNDTKNVFKDINIENYILFNSTIKDSYNSYDVNCKIWKPNDENNTFIIICNFEDYLKDDIYSGILEDTIVNYTGYTIYIYQEYSFKVNVYSYHIPFLYYDNQTIDIDNKDSYELKFKVESYNNDLLYIKGKTNNYAVLENCKRNGNDLNCNIQKNKLEEILTLSGEQFTVGTMNDNEGLIQFEYVSSITINYNNVIKEDLFINITKIVGDTNELETPLALETNITSIPNFISDKFYLLGNSGYFKKTTGRPLILFYNYNPSSSYIYFNIDKEEIINNVHYKYNFRIQPYGISQKISIRGKRTEINLIYPDELDFSKEEPLIIRYITSYPDDISNIKLNINSPDLECKDLNEMKRCNASLSHFVGEESGYYDTYHLNPHYVLSINYEANKINVTLPKEDIIKIYVNNEDNNKTINIDQNSLIYFITNYTDNETIFDESDIEEKTTFQTEIANNRYTNYKVSCRLWKPRNEKIRIFCKLNQGLSQNTIKIFSSVLSYKGKKIAIISEMDFVTKIGDYYYSNIPFLYSSAQTLNLGDGQNLYDIIFKIGEYNYEKLVLTSEENEFNNIVLDKCNIEGNNLICKITKEKITEILIFSGQIFKCIWLNENNGRLLRFDNIFDIVINYNNIRKESVYIGITNLLTSYSSIYHYLVYETNITSISNIITNKFIYNYSDTTNVTCFMKKAFEKPLLLLCKIPHTGTHRLGEIKQEIRLENITIKYNLLIQPVNNNETFTLRDENIDTILSAYPMVLDYYLGDKLNIIFYSKEYNNIAKIKLNYYSSIDISCTNRNNMKSCDIPLNHFYNQNGYYYVYYYSNYKRDYYPFYELSPIQVILPEENELIIRIRNSDNENGYIIGQNGAISFFTDYNYTNLNIFNESTIEKDTTFKATFSGNDINYTADCFFWIPENSDMIMICKFDENITSEYITLNKYNFEYKNQTIIIVSEGNLRIIQSNSSIAFLYSNEQYIEIKGNVDTNIKFKKAAYNKETLILYNTNKNIILECREETNEIICPIKSEKISEILTYSGEEFRLCQLTNSGEKLALDFVSNIIIINDNIQKQLNNINTIKLLTPVVYLNSYISYETNIKDIPKISTDSFNIATNKNSNLNCFFKKNNNNDPLLLLCKAENYGNFTLGKIKDNYLDDINILYHFDIIATQNDEICWVSSTKGPKIYSVYPESLDFRSNDKLIINYLVDDPDKLKGIKLNNDSSFELECQNKNGIKECIVPKTHFTSNGDYYTYYTNSRRYKSISYEISKIHVIIENDDDSKSYVGIIVGSIIGGLVLIVIIAFLIWRFCKKKNDSPEEKKEVILLSNKELELKTDQ